MLAFFSKIKKRIRETLDKRNRLRKERSYAIIMESSIIPVKCDSSLVEPETSAPSTRRLFCYDIEESSIQNDFECQELLTTMRRARIELAGLVLEPRIEEMIENIPNTTSITKVKLRIIYIIIALDIYNTLFVEKKHYRSLRSTRYLGVFRYKEYIIRIDDSPYSFINEADVSNALEGTVTAESGVVLPFLIYTNIRRDKCNKICECVPSSTYCECKYYDNAGSHPSMDNLKSDALSFYNKLRKDAISFSIQYYVENTMPLYNWVKDNFGSYVYSQFSNIQYPFFIHLFYKCAVLFRILHRAGIVHGDVKPDNILIREESTFDIHHPERCKHFKVFLIDFGLSGIQGKGYGTGGTIPYCHPEFKNIRDTNKSSKYYWKTLEVKHDVWSLGIGFLTMYIYRDFYSYYYKYPKYFFTNTGYVSSLILDVITHSGLHELFTKMMTQESISINEVCDLLHAMITKDQQV